MPQTKVYFPHFADVRMNGNAEGHTMKQVRQLSGMDILDLGSGYEFRGMIFIGLIFFSKPIIAIHA